MKRINKNTNWIIIEGAREHNLKNINIKLPRNKLTVITGLSGSGKSSLAFDTLYAEAQRRFVESLSAYARQFLGLMEKPDVDKIFGLTPSIAIEQKSISKNPRSTVGTVTEIYDYLRLLFARIGKVYCPNCNIEINKQSIDKINSLILKNALNKKIYIVATAVRGRKGEYKSILEKILKQGFLRVIIDNKIYNLDRDKIELDKNKKHTIKIIVDRLKLTSDKKERLNNSVETACKISNGIVEVYFTEEKIKPLIYSTKFSCIKCNFSFVEIEPRNFSFNSPYGACPNCDGLGTNLYIDPEMILDEENSIIGGGVKLFFSQGSYAMQTLIDYCKKNSIPYDIPLNNLTEEQKNILLYNFSRPVNQEVYKKTKYSEVEIFSGVIPWMWNRYRFTSSENIRWTIQRYMTESRCSECNGARLKKEYLSVKINNLNISQICEKSIKQALEFFENITLTQYERKISKLILNEIIQRLNFLDDVGLNYLSIDRTSKSLSGGESQRVNLATSVGSGLAGVTYILDEPSIGLHPKDNSKLLETLQKLKNLGNTVIVVEHDEDTMRSADYIIELGPFAGERGGALVYQGDLKKFLKLNNTITAKYLNKILCIESPKTRRKPNDKFILLKGAIENNLKNIDVKIPVGLITCVTGVSGSGKSTLILDTLYNALVKRIYKKAVKIGKYEVIEGFEYFRKVINIDQSPIGRTPRSNPATYVGVFTYIRNLYADLPESKARGYKPGRFSFNVKAGRCSTCEGAGMIKIEMNFLPDVYVRCQDCQGKRYSESTLEVKYKNKNIAEVLEMSVNTAYNFFKHIPQIEEKLRTLKDVGLGYIKLGQSATTLSGGEAQRIKLAAELSKREEGKNLYLLDEPTTGLHYDDVKKLINVLQRLADKGNTIIIIEHNLEVIKCADWIIDLGPLGGEKGGEVLYCGEFKKILNCKKSYTADYLRKILKKIK